jgi:hypothetical protein
MSTQLAAGETTLLAETHAISSGLKTYVSSNVVEGVETVRRAMGGHGFLASTGIGRIYATELPSTTYEGDNLWVVYRSTIPLSIIFEADLPRDYSILNLQVARSALKAFTNLVTAKAPREALSRLTPSSAYLATLAPPPTLPLQLPSTLESWKDHSLLQRLLSLRAALTVARVARMMEPQGGKKFGDLSWECVALSEAVVEAFLAKVMVDALAEGGSLAQAAGSNEHQVLKQVVTFVSLMQTPGVLFACSLDIANLFCANVAVPPPPRAKGGPCAPRTRHHRFAATSFVRPAVRDIARRGGPRARGTARRARQAGESAPPRAGWFDRRVRLLGLGARLGRKPGFYPPTLSSSEGGTNGHSLLQVARDGAVYERMLAKAKADEKLNIGEAADQKRLYAEYIKPVLQRGRRINAHQGKNSARL